MRYIRRKNKVFVRLPSNIDAGENFVYYIPDEQVEECEKQLLKDGWEIRDWFESREKDTKKFTVIKSAEELRDILTPALEEFINQSNDNETRTKMKIKLQQAILQLFREGRLLWKEIPKGLFEVKQKTELVQYEDAEGIIREKYQNCPEIEITFNKEKLLELFK